MQGSDYARILENLKLSQSQSEIAQQQEPTRKSYQLQARQLSSNPVSPVSGCGDSNTGINKNLQLSMIMSSIGSVASPSLALSPTEQQLSQSSQYNAGVLYGN